MKKIWVIRIALALVSIITAICLFNNLSISHTDAQGFVHKSSIKVADSHVEIIQVTLPNDSVKIHIRDRSRLMDVTLEYVNNELILQKIVSNEESVSKIVSIGKDFTSGELVGSTWRLSEKATLENRAALKKSIVEDVIKKLQSNEWRSVSEETIQGKKVDKVKSEHLDSIEFVYFDFETGLPVRQEFFKKDNLGNPLSNAERIEEYSYMEAIPLKFLDTKQVVIQKGPAPIQRDIAD